MARERKVILEQVANTLPPRDERGRLLRRGTSAYATASAKRRDRVRALTTLDKRTVVWRRVVELQRVFTTALAAGGCELSPVRKLKVEHAAQALAVAELARGKYMRDGDCDLDDLIRAERRADALIKKLGLPAEAEPAQAVGAPAAAPALTGLSNVQLDRLYGMLSEVEANKGNGSVDG